MNQVFKQIKLVFPLLILIFSLASCNHERKESIENYHRLVNKAELAICEENFREALDHYGLAFRKIDRPFASDLYNASLAAQASEYWAERDQYLQQLINGSADVAMIKATFLASFMTVQEWDILESNRIRDFDQDLREELTALSQSTKENSTSENIALKKNPHARNKSLDRLLEIESEIGFPSHKEIGYSENQRKQPHHDVLRHSAMMRMSDKKVKDLEPILRKAVMQGRLDPELAISYMEFQDDKEKGRYENYAISQFRHPLLPDSMNYSKWIPKLNQDERKEINELRIDWLADTVEEIERKTAYKNNSSWPFLFTSVTKEKTKMSDEYTAEEAAEQYLLCTENMQMLN